MQVQPLAEKHPFAQTLKDWEHGVKVDCGDDWDWDVIEAAVERGPHPSADTKESYELFRDDIRYQEKAGFCKVYSWEELKRLRPKKLKVSPAAVVPQRDRRGRIILDLSYPVTYVIDGKSIIVQESVNVTTKIKAPQQPVKEIGKVFPRLCQYLKSVPRGAHVLFSKADISDGFWRLIVEGDDCFNFAYVLPQPPGEPIRIVVPSALQMGWVESPGYFCCATETIRDLIHYHVDNETQLPHDPVEDKLSVPEVPRRAREESPSKLLQVYVDDFCNAATQSMDGSHLPTISRATVHSIHSIFPPPDVTGHEGGKQPMSEKKLDKGEGIWSTQKEMIGFDWDGAKRTVTLPEEKSKRYTDAAKSMLQKKKVPTKKFQKVVGQLKHAAMIMPAAKGFFTPINRAVQGQPKHIGLGSSSEIRHSLTDICELLKMLTKRPTHVDEIIPGAPKYIGFHDAAAEGAGGVWFSLECSMPPIVWRTKFPEDIQRQVVSDSNPTGTLTNSDLELAAEVLAVGVLIDHTPSVKRMTVGTLCDNTPTVSWINNMASKASTPTAGRLLRGLALMMFTNHMGPLVTTHVAGDDNILADIASRPTKAKQFFRANSPTHLTDPQFLQLFLAAFPLPHKAKWEMPIVTGTRLASNVFATLRGTRLEMQQWIQTSARNTGKHGSSSPVEKDWTLISKGRAAPNNSTHSLPLLSSSGKATSATELRSEFNQLKKLLGTSPKSLFWTCMATPDGPTQPKKN